MRKVKLGLISFAHPHAYSYLQDLMNMPDVEVVGIADENAEHVRSIVEQYSISYYDSHHSLLLEPLDAVIICSENVHHARLTLDAAAAGKHILCEKPLGTSLDEMRQMIQSCKDNGVQLMIAFPCRFIPAVMEAKALIDRGEIGDILAIKGTNRGRMPGGWFIDKELSAGGALLDHTVHVMDLMNWMLRSRVKEVYAESGILFHDDLNIDDAGMVHVIFENGVMAVLDPSWSRVKSFPFGVDITVEIIGTKGVLSIDGFAQKTEIYDDRKTKAQWDFYGESMNRFMLEGFVEAVRNGTTVPISGEDGLLSAVVALAAYESVRLGEPVRLEL